MGDDDTLDPITQAAVITDREHRRTCWRREAGCSATALLMCTSVGRLTIGIGQPQARALFAGYVSFLVALLFAQRIPHDLAVFDAPADAWGLV